MVLGRDIMNFHLVNCKVGSLVTALKFPSLCHLNLGWILIKTIIGEVVNLEEIRTKGLGALFPSYASPDKHHSVACKRDALVGVQK